MSEYEPDSWRKLARLLRARRAQVDGRFSKRTVFCQETGLNYKLVADIEGSPDTRTTFEPETFALFEKAYRWAPGSIESVLGGGDPVELGEPTSVTLQGPAGSMRFRPGRGSVEARQVEAEPEVEPEVEDDPVLAHFQRLLELAKQVDAEKLAETNRLLEEQNRLLEEQNRILRERDEDDQRRKRA